MGSGSGLGASVSSVGDVAGAVNDVAATGCLPVYTGSSDGEDRDEEKDA